MLCTCKQNVQLYFVSMFGNFDYHKYTNLILKYAISKDFNFELH
jgi:hypothetical protein